MAPYTTGLANAVLREISELLDRLVTTGEAGSIDLHSLPMTDGDREQLKEKLGTGEVSVKLDVAGSSTLDETGIAGVWWVRHEGGDGRLAAEIIEITHVPAILLSHRDDMIAGLNRLDELLDAPADMDTEDMTG
ncbi:MAG: hydrogenase expression/formation C-terminal domain-containing protein [Hyphomonas sp.]